VATGGECDGLGGSSAVFGALALADADGAWETDTEVVGVGVGRIDETLAPSVPAGAVSTGGVALDVAVPALAFCTPALDVNEPTANAPATRNATAPATPRVTHLRDGLVSAGSTSTAFALVKTLVSSRSVEIFGSEPGA